jgi:hypothetical protein
MVQGVGPPTGHGIGIGALFQEQADPFRVVPVSFAEQQRGQGLGVQLSAFEQSFEGLVVVAFGGMIGGLFVIGIGSVLKQEPGEAGVMGDARGSIDGAFKIISYQPVLAGAPAWSRARAVRTKASERD